MCIRDRAAPDADAEQGAVGDGVDGLRQLVARVLRIGEGVEPGVHAHLHVAEGHERADAADGDETQTDDQVELLSRSHVQHDQEDVYKRQIRTQGDIGAAYRGPICHHQAG